MVDPRSRAGFFWSFWGVIFCLSALWAKFLRKLRFFMNSYPVRRPLKCRKVARRRYPLARRRRLHRRSASWRFLRCLCHVVVGALQFMLLFRFCLIRLVCKTPEPRHPVALNTQLRGGGQAGGASVTKRKRKEKLAQNEILNKLCNLLGTFLHESSPPGSKKKRKRNKKQADDKPGPSAGHGLVDDLAKLVDDIRQDPRTLVTKLEGFLQRAKSVKNVQASAAGTSGKPNSWASVVKQAAPAKKGSEKRPSHAVNLARHCWDKGEIRDFGEVMKKLEVGENLEGSVAIAPSLDKALEAQQLAQVHKLSLKFACVVVGVDASKLPSGVTMVTLPVSFSNGPGVQSTKFQKMACVLLGNESPSLPMGLVKQVQSAPPLKELATVRFFVPKMFLSKAQWQLWNAKATSMVQEWSGGSSGRCIHASYGWAATTQANWKGDKEDFVIGYAKVPVEKIDEVLAKSGRSGVFVDRLAKERDKRQFVSWIQFDVGDPAAYLSKALSDAKAANSAVVWRAGGGNCLGVRSSTAPAVNAVSVWRVKGAPFSWSDSDLFKVLTEAGWTELSVVAFPTKKIRPWLLKAKAPDSVAGVAGIEAGNILLLVERAGARSPVTRESKKLAAKPVAGGLPSIIKPTGPIELDSDVELEQADEVVAPTQLDSAPAAEDAAMNSQDGEAGVKRVGSPPPSAEHVRKKVKDRNDLSKVPPRKLVFPGFTVRDCGAEGSCGYNAIAVGCALMRGGAWESVSDKCAVMGATLRVQVAMHVANDKHVREYRPFWTADTSHTSVEKEDGPIPLTWESWLVAIRRPKRWLCGLTIKAAATRLGVKIIVVLKQPDQSWGMPVAFGNCKKKEQPVVIGLDEQAGHYILLVPDNPDAIPSSWLNAGQCEVTMISQNVLRGAGNEDNDLVDKSWLPPATPSSHRSRVSAWLPPATPQSRVEDGGCAWLPSATASCAPSTFVKDSVIAVAPTESNMSVHAAEDQSQDAASDPCRPTLVSWLCPVCRKCLDAPSVASLARKRRLHIALHAQESRKSVNGPAASSGPDPFVWTCHVCESRFESHSQVRLSALRSRHLAHRHPGEARGPWRQERIEVVDTSIVIPSEERGWTCVWCREGLPDLPRAQMNKSISAHLRKRHGRRLTSAAASNKARGKLYRKDKNALPAMRQGKRSLGKKLRERGHARRDWHCEGHDLREVTAVDWSTWHGCSPKKRKGAGGDTLLTCLTCLLVRRAQHQFKPCRGNRQVNTQQMCLWRSLSENNKRALLDAWS